MANDHVSVDRFGVTSAVSTGHASSMSYCPGGSHMAMRGAVAMMDFMSAEKPDQPDQTQNARKSDRGSGDVGADAGGHISADD